MNKRVLLAFAYATRASTALLLALNLNSLTTLAAVFVLGGAYVGMEETLEDSLAAELLPDVLRGTGFGTMAVVNGVGDFVSSLTVGWLNIPSNHIIWIKLPNTECRRLVLHFVLWLRY
jgi:hypothetical protein